MNMVADVELGMLLLQALMSTTSSLLMVKLAVFPSLHVSCSPQSEPVHVPHTGAVGVIVGQLCKHVYGCKVFGVAGSDEKV
jgi:NADPH-dependent curcumin reductase CurA